VLRRTLATRGGDNPWHPRETLPVTTPESSKSLLLFSTRAHFLGRGTRIVRCDDVHIMFATNDRLGAPRLTGTLSIVTTGVPALHRRIAADVEVLWGPGVDRYGIREFAIKDCNAYTLTFGEETSDPPACES
jgi:hypothetical protein